MSSSLISWDACAVRIGLQHPTSAYPISTKVYRPIPWFQLISSLHEATKISSPRWSHGPPKTWKEIWSHLHLARGVAAWQSCSCSQIDSEKVGLEARVRKCTGFACVSKLFIIQGLGPSRHGIPWRWTEESLHISKTPFRGGSTERPILLEFCDLQCVGELTNQDHSVHFGISSKNEQMARNIKISPIIYIFFKVSIKIYLNTGSWLENNR